MKIQSMEVNAIYEGDNLEIMNKFPDKSIDLIYADPPFYTNRRFEIIWNDGAEKRAFEDRWAGGIEHYVGWMEPRIRECYRLLKEGGSMYLHCDDHAAAHLRILMDKVFGEKSFINDIIHYGHTFALIKITFESRNPTSLSLNYSTFFDKLIHSLLTISPISLNSHYFVIRIPFCSSTWP